MFDKLSHTFSVLADRLSRQASLLNVLLTAALSIFAVDASLADERRVALVIGNSSYSSVPRLENPANDASAVAAALKTAGFEKVVLVNNASREKLVNALREFGAAAEKSDWAVIFYAGHGIEMGGVNYMVPVDARVAVDRDLEFEGVPMSQALASLEGARKLRLLILDACRDNPFAATMTRTAGATRSIGRGLARVEPDTGTLVAYAAKDGQVAQDGDGRNSPFSAALVRNLQTPGLELNRLFRRVTSDVLKTTNRRQEPYTYGSLPDEEFYFKPVPKGEPVAVATPGDLGVPSKAVEPAKPTQISPAAPPTKLDVKAAPEPSVTTNQLPPRNRPALANVDPRPTKSTPSAVRRIAPLKQRSLLPKTDPKLAARKAIERRMLRAGFKRSGQPGNPWYKPTCDANGVCQLND